MPNRRRKRGADDGGGAAADAGGVGGDESKRDLDLRITNILAEYHAPRPSRRALPLLELNGRVLAEEDEEGEAEVVSPLTAPAPVLPVVVVDGRPSKRRVVAGGGDEASPYQRRLWVKDRSSEWWELRSSPGYPEAEFLREFRMGRATFGMVCDALGAAVAKEDTALRAAIPVRQRVAVCVWRLATGEPLRLVSKRFGIGISTCHKLVLERWHNILHASIFSPDHMSRVCTLPSSSYTGRQNLTSSLTMPKRPLYRFTVPHLRPGTLDSLLALSDDLVKSNIFIEGVSHKIRRQIEDLERAGGVEPGTLTVDGVPVDSYLTRFVWDEGKYPVNAPLKETVASIQSQVAKIEDDMKMTLLLCLFITPLLLHADQIAHGCPVRVAEYGNVKSQLGAINRKQTGSLAVRDLSNLIKPEDMVTSEHLVTLLSIVPKYSQKDWLSSYESLDTFVVPRSSKKLYEDNEYALYTVTLFAKVVDNFKVHAREKGFQIRDFEYSPEAQESRKQELEKLLQDQEVMRTSLLQWCYASYSEVFSSWMHFSAVRVFVESILRYGLPARFLSVVLAPSTKSEKKVRSILEGLCGNANSSYWRSEDDVGMAAGLGGETESHPYVSFTINFV